MLGALDMFAIGIGPSSSHTIGPMKAAANWVQFLAKECLINKTEKVNVHLFGSLALTGEGHGTIFAILNGLLGEQPKTIDPNQFLLNVNKIKSENKIIIGKQKIIKINYLIDIILNKNTFLEQHANGMRFIAFDADGKELNKREYFSIGGGFILDEEQIKLPNIEDSNDITIPYPFKTAKELFSLCKKHNITIAQLVTKNELVRKTEAQIKEEALEIIKVMRDSIQRGLITDGILPGGLKVKRRAPDLFRKLNNNNVSISNKDHKLFAIAYAIGVNEENAAFGKVVTAPTNGSAGTIPAVLEYYYNFYSSEATEEKLIEFILTAGAIGMLYKFGASISAAEVGCQGEIGVACSMAAGALTAVLGGNLIQIEKAAEIAMEHNLGMTCDPIEGLVQIPCIERNGVAASRAVDIAKLSLLEEEAGKISLDDIIKTMLQTGKDMSMKYKETALGGLAVNVVNC